MKLLLSEPGAASVGQIWLMADERVSSLLLYAEAAAAVARARRAGRRQARRFETPLARLEHLWPKVVQLAVTERLVRRAGELADAFGLRAYDAIHLASLEAVGGRETVLVSADDELLKAARALGFATARLTS